MYTEFAPDTAGAGFGDPIKIGAKVALAAFFVSLRLASVYGRAGAGRPSGLPVAILAGSPTLHVPAHPLFGDR